MHVRSSILRKLTDALQPVTIEVIDESEQHHGHGGWREGGETHFRVRLVSAPSAASRGWSGTASSTVCWPRN